MWVKICGIRDVQTALDVAALGGDAIGLNFYPQSKRYVASSVAREIVAGLKQFEGGKCEAVGLFVNADLPEICRTIDEVALTTIQLHGDEPPALVAELNRKYPTLNIIRAFRVGSSNTQTRSEGGTSVDAGHLKVVEAGLDSIAQAGGRLWGCLIDALVPGSYGGTGVAVSWTMLSREWKRDDWPRLILAGGLFPENVAQAIAESRTWGVDVASGVESSPAIKSLPLVNQFITNARAT
ncbi:MAG: phosphoribosylanthranilate isomerase [Planctomycetaceae bacterium]